LRDAVPVDAQAGRETEYVWPTVTRRRVAVRLWNRTHPPTVALAAFGRSRSARAWSVVESLTVVAQGVRARSGDAATATVRAPTALAKTAAATSPVVARLMPHLSDLSRST
jgi:hypothetical protein